MTTFKTIVLEKDIINIEQLQEYLSNYYPVEQRRRLKVIYPFTEEKYVIVRGEERYFLVNLSNLSIACIGDVEQSLVDFVEQLYPRGYKVLIEIDKDVEK